MIIFITFFVSTFTEQDQLLSYTLASFASFTALDLADRIKETRGAIRNVWIGGCAFTMGAGIWSMHFTAMLAFKLPLTVTYDIWTTLFSLIIAITISGIGFFLVNSGKPVLISNIVKGGVLMGAGVVWMHYTGMAAMEISGSMHYKPGLFILSIIIAILAATAALGLVNYFGNKERAKLSPKLVASLFMGLSVFGMHFTGMAAVVFTTPKNVTPILQVTSDFEMLAFGVSGVAFFIAGMALLVSITQREIQRLVSYGDFWCMRNEWAAHPLL